MARRQQQEVSPWWWLAGAAGVGTVGYLVYRALSGPQPDQLPAAAGAPPPQLTFQQQAEAFRQQFAPTETAHAGMAGMVMGPQRDRNGIPIVALPGESANRTRQLRAMSGLPATSGHGNVAGLSGLNGTVPNGNGQAPARSSDGSSLTESFGGGESGGLGGERF
jgi:hypothetical protein